MSTIAFGELARAAAPAEALGRARSDVALLVATRRDGALQCARFHELAQFLVAGDVLVFNTSATLAAALPARLDGDDVVVHLSTPTAPGRWVVELRSADLGRLARPPLGSALSLPDHGHVILLAPYRGSDRLTEAEVRLPGATDRYLSRHGMPIRYVDDAPRWPLDAYQTVFARQPGSAEMASAGRPFSVELVTELMTRGILLAPLTLHAGVSSLECDEAPYPERYRVPRPTANLINAAHAWGGRVVAVGTTVVRALETAARPDGSVEGAEGWTDLMITRERGLRAVDGLITGWHEPRSSHLLMLEAAAGHELLERCYAEAARLGLAGHEFGDAHLILP